MKLTPQQALEEARKRYTEGTEYISVNSNNRALLVKNTDDFTIQSHGRLYIICDDPQTGIIYSSKSNNWAEIISTPKSLEDRLVDGFGFVKHSNGDGCKLKLKQIRIFILPDLDGSTKVNLWLEDAFICSNPNNLEDFIKAYLRLF
jgi:hypothetical protein